MTLDFTHKLAQVRTFGERLAALALIGAGLLLSVGTQVASASPIASVSHMVSTSRSPDMSINCEAHQQDHETIRRGDYGGSVSHAQCLLKYNRGQSIEVDGDFGSQTEGAVLNVQRYCGLDDDGIVGPKTWHALHYGC